MVRAMFTAVSASMPICFTYFSTEMWNRESTSALLSTPYVLNRSTVFFALRIGNAATESAMIGQAAPGRFLVPVGRVVVAVEDDPLVLLDLLLEQLRAPRPAAWPATGLRARRPLQLAGEVVERLRHDGVQHRVGPGDAGARAHRAELELVAGEGERADVRLRSPECRGSCGSVRAPRSSVPPRSVRLGRPCSTCARMSDSIVAQEDRDDRGRGLVGAEAVVVGGRGDRGAEQVGVEVHRADHRAPGTPGTACWCACRPAGRAG